MGNYCFKKIEKPNKDLKIFDIEKNNSEKEKINKQIMSDGLEEIKNKRQILKGFSCDEKDHVKKIENEGPINRICNSQTSNLTKKYIDLIASVKTIQSNDNFKLLPINNIIYCEFDQEIDFSNKNILNEHEYDYNLLTFLEKTENDCNGSGLIIKCYSKRECEYCSIHFIQSNEKYVSDFATLSKKINFLNNQNISKFYGIYNLKKKICSITESGILSMSNILSVGNYYNEEEASYIGHYLSSTLAELEKNHIAHRNLNTDNLMLVQSNNFEYVYKIANFTLSCCLMNKNHMLNIDKLSGYNDNFSSPEIKEIYEKKYKEENYNPFIADVYSFGVVMMKMMGLKSKKAIENINNKELKFLLLEILENDPKKRRNFNFEYIERNLQGMNRLKPKNDQDSVEKWNDLNNINIDFNNN